MSNIEYYAWLIFSDKVESQIETDLGKKIETQNKKLRKLREKIKHDSCPPIEIVPDYVKNMSTHDFTTKELNLLNRGLKYSPQPIKPDINAIVSFNIETTLKYMPDNEKEKIRKEIKPILKTATIKKKDHNQKSKEESDIVKTLKLKDVYYLKADKGNSLVIMDKENYNKTMWDSIKEGNFIELRKNPLNKMIRESNSIAAEISKIYEIPKWKLTTPNSRTPVAYGLPKIHKPGNKMRMICSNIDAPSSKIAKWLVDEFGKLDQPEGLYVKNSLEIVDKIKNIRLEEDEVLASFDVTALYPSIPIQEALKNVEDWLRLLNVEQNKSNTLLKALRLCMNHNQFQFREKFYKQTEGTSMGNPASCFIANTFLGKFEMELKRAGKLPKIWLRYVDDILVIIKKQYIQPLLEIVNNVFPSIKFTVEEEKENKLPFLDLMLKRVNNTIQFDIYRKPTTTNRFITRDSYCDRKHKMAAFNSMAYRLNKIPLSAMDYMNEYKNIKNIGRVNGFKDQDIDNIIKKQAKKIKRKELTTLMTLDEKMRTRTTILPFENKLSESIKKVLKKNEIEVVYRNNRKLCNLLENPKDKRDNIEKSGIYSITCGDCNKKYIGQTKRSIKKRFQEHIYHAKINQPLKSAVALHIISENHDNFSLNNLKLEKAVNNVRELDAWESLHIARNGQAIINNDNGPISSSLFKLRTNRGRD